MYYHPLILPTASSERALKTYRALSDVWLDSVERHQAAHSDAAKRFRSAQLENARLLSEAADGAQFATRLVVCIAVEPFRLAALAAELGEIVVDSHRQTLRVFDSKDPESTITHGVEDDRPLPVAGGRDRPVSGRKLQMMA